LKRRAKRTKHCSEARGFLFDSVRASRSPFHALFPLSLITHALLFLKHNSRASERKEAKAWRRSTRGRFVFSSSSFFNPSLLLRLLARRSSFLSSFPLSFPRCSSSPLRRKEETTLSNVQRSTSEQTTYQKKKQKKRSQSQSSLTVVALDVSAAMVPLLPAAKDALSARYTHEMLVNARTTELALMAFGTAGPCCCF